MKKVWGLTSIIVGMMVLGACGNSGTKNSESSTEVSASNQLEKIKQEGVLKVGTSADFAPFEFHTMINGKDTIVGADIDMVNALAEEIGIDEVQFVDMEFNAVLAALDQKQVDIAVSGISATEERKKSVDFTMNYFLPEQKVVVHKDNLGTYKTIDDLEGKKVGAQKGSIQESIVTDQLPDSQIVSIPKVPNLVIEIKQGTIDALVLESAVAESYVGQNDDLAIAEVELVTSEDEAYAIALPKGSTELQEALNEGLQKLIDDGKIAEFVQKNTDLANENAAK
ncbi:transporter substrate-binding domain-containing protein [Enterococcus saccharolyticus]|uniref:transporter substrate-binding domain-containing protein n=1 Tax=Enterococcus TaxID=1350 RepID=UPI001E28B798|nr:transporter substrate-binding domain-containing protein [Enterococcus saccharolyticus]MCD5001016.1 transporter substrate-binding domain-containing protein [Enterococcus saccharolyticus]